MMRHWPRANNQSRRRRSWQPGLAAVDLLREVLPHVNNAIRMTIGNGTPRINSNNERIVVS